jgi:LmbE family N-acetylglucosaminyl deacetylase
LMSLVHLKVTTQQAFRPLRIMAIGAHPDDIEIGCGATLAKLRDSGHVISGLVMTAGEVGGRGHIRVKEAKKSSIFLGVDQLKIKPFQDTKLAEHNTEMVKAIEDVIEEFSPDIAFTHSEHDIHQDHQSVHYATLRAGRNLGTILCYESPSATQDFRPNFFMEIDKYIDIKIESIKEHRDQRKKSFVQPELIKGLAVYRGSQVKTAYAEGFEAIRIRYPAFWDGLGTPASGKSKLDSVYNAIRELGELNLYEKNLSYWSWWTSRPKPYVDSIKTRLFRYWR